MSTLPLPSSSDIAAAMKRRPRFHLPYEVGKRTYRALGFTVALTREGFEPTYCVGIAGNIFRVDKQDLSQALDDTQAQPENDPSLVDDLTAMLQDFHRQNKDWGIYWTRADWENRGDLEVVPEIKHRLNTMLERLGHDPVE